MTIDAVAIDAAWGDAILGPGLRGRDTEVGVGAVARRHPRQTAVLRRIVRVVMAVTVVRICTVVRLEISLACRSWRSTRDMTCLSTYLTSKSAFSRKMLQPLLEAVNSGGFDLTFTLDRWVSRSLPVAGLDPPVRRVWERAFFLA